MVSFFSEFLKKYSPLKNLKEDEEDKAHLNIAVSVYKDILANIIKGFDMLDTTPGQDFITVNIDSLLTIIDQYIIFLKKINIEYFDKYNKLLWGSSIDQLETIANQLRNLQSEAIKDKNDIIKGTLNLNAKVIDNNTIQLSVHDQENKNVIEALYNNFGIEPKTPRKPKSPKP